MISAEWTDRLSRARSLTRLTGQRRARARDDGAVLLATQLASRQAGAVAGMLRRTLLWLPAMHPAATAAAALDEGRQSHLRLPRCRVYFLFAAGN